MVISMNHSNGLWMRPTWVIQHCYCNTALLLVLVPLFSMFYLGSLRCILWISIALNNGGPAVSTLQLCNAIACYTEKLMGDRLCSVYFNWLLRVDSEELTFIPLDAWGDLERSAIYACFPLSSPRFPFLLLSSFFPSYLTMGLWLMVIIEMVVNTEHVY